MRPMAGPPETAEGTVVDELVASAAEAVGDVPSGASLAVGGHGLCGIPSVLTAALSGTGAGNLEVVSNMPPSKRVPAVCVHAAGRSFAFAQVTSASCSP